MHLPAKCHINFINLRIRLCGCLASQFIISKCAWVADILLYKESIMYREEEFSRLEISLQACLENYKSENEKNNTDNENDKILFVLAFLGNLFDLRLTAEKGTASFAEYCNLRIFCFAMRADFFVFHNASFRTELLLSAFLNKLLYKQEQGAPSFLFRW